MAELKKCPFCGGKADTYSSIRGFWSVDCESNECITHTMVTNYDTREEAIEAWNNRATEAEIRAKAIDEFAEKLKKYTYGRTNGVYVEIPLYILDEIAEQLKGE